MSEVKKTIGTQKEWMSSIQILFSLIVLMFFLYQKTVISIAEMWWTSETYAHGIAIIPFSLYMIWTNRQQLALLMPSFSWKGILLLLPFVLIWLTGALVDVLVIQQLGFLGMVWALILAVMGWTVVKHILFPLAFLFFTIPIGEGLIPVLMDITAVFTVKALILTGIPVYWEGMYFAIPSGNFEVAKACSGVRYLFASIALGSLFAYINFNGYKKRTIFIIVSILLPIIANGFRAYGIVLIAHYSNLKYAVGVDHLVYGWIFFGLIMFLLFYMGNKWGDSASEEAVAHVMPLSKNYNFNVVIPVFFLFVTSIGPIVMALTEREHVVVQGAVLQAPELRERWTRTQDASIQPWDIGFNGASHELNLIYVNGLSLARLYVAFYENESQGTEAINQGNRLYNVEQWTEVKRSTISLTLRDGEVVLNQQILRSGDYERIIWYGYDLDGFITNNIYVGKLMQAWKRLTGKDRGAAVMVFMADVTSGREDTADQLEDFVNAIYSPIQESLLNVRNRHQV